MGAPVVHPAAAGQRAQLVRRGQRLSWLTLGYNLLEGVIGIGAGILAGSIALVGFGVDSVIELAASVAALWRLRADRDPGRREHAERTTLRIVGSLFLALAAYVAWDAAGALNRREAPEESMPGIILAAASLLVMPVLARAKRRVAAALGSRALHSESRQTQLCTYLSAILLGGLLLNAAIGWWWADPVAALVMVPIIAREGIEGLRGHDPCGDACSTTVP
ncbi:MAG TPA: cation transporter [Gemmatimonadaceae bacterium]